MANLQVRDIDDRLYEAIRALAKQKHRSISQQVVHIIEEYLSSAQKDLPQQTDAFLALSGAWEGSETAEEIIKTIRTSRKNAARFTPQNGLFD